MGIKVVFIKELCWVNSFVVLTKVGGTDYSGAEIRFWRNDFSVKCDILVLGLRVFDLQLVINVETAIHGYILLLTPYVTWNYSSPHIHRSMQIYILAIESGD